MVLARDTSENLSMLGVEFKLGERFLPDVEPLWVPESKAASLERVGISIMNHARILAYHLSLLLARHASSFLGMQESKYLLDKMEERAPDLVREATACCPRSVLRKSSSGWCRSRYPSATCGASLKRSSSGAPRKRIPSCSPSTSAAP